MELRHLRYFLAVAEELHFGKAAKRVHISQPPLSSQIRQLEEDLRVKLLYRTKRTVELTEAGRIFAGEARLILQQVERAAGLAAEANRGEPSQLVVGYSPANAIVTVNILKEFAKRYPESPFLMKSLVTLQQVEALRSGRIDLGFLTLPVQGEDLMVETVLREKFVVAVSKKHPLSQRRRIPMRALAGERLIIFPLYLNPGRYDVIAQLCREAGFSLNAVHEVDNVLTMLELVAEGFGISLMRASVQGLVRPGIAFVELQHSPVVETGIAYKRQNPSMLLLQFVEVAKQVSAQRLPWSVVPPVANKAADCSK